MSSIGPTSTEYIERELFADAVQACVEDIVSDVLCSETKILDYFLQDGYLSGDLCSEIRKLQRKKDQIRFLICNILGKDLKVLKSFVNYLSLEGYDYIAEKIKTKYREINNVTSYHRQRCFYSEIFENVDIEIVCDWLFANKAISSDLYSHISNPYCRQPGSQISLWTRLFDELSIIADDNERENAYIQLKLALQDNHYQYIASKIDIRDMVTNRQTNCCYTHTQEERFRQSKTNRDVPYTNLQIQVQNAQREEYDRENYNTHQRLQSVSRNGATQYKEKRRYEHNPDKSQKAMHGLHQRTHW